MLFFFIKYFKKVLSPSGWVPDKGSVFHMQKTDQLRMIIDHLMKNNNNNFSIVGKTHKFTEVFLLER